MPKKKSPGSATTMSLENVNRRDILRIVFDKVNMEPPVGERYEFLVRKIIDASIDEYGVLSEEDRELLTNELFTYVASYGPIEQYFHDPQISEVMVNGPGQIFIEKNGQMILTDLNFDNNEHVRFAINHIINPMGRFISSKHPLIDSRLPDGSRVNAVVPPVSPNGPCITIRRFLKDKLTVEELVGLGSLTSQIAEFLAICVQASLNIVVAGNTSSGKTTLLNILTHQIPDWERIVTIEDSAELSLHQIHVVSLEAQPPDYRGEGGVTVRDLVRNALRMRPDRIVVGEVRGGEALDMLQAMNTGHDGSLSTVHSNSPRDALMRLETLVALTGMNISSLFIRKYISSALNIVVHLARMVDGSRKIVSFQEITGMEGDVVTMQEIFSFEQTGLDDTGRIKGKFRAKGIKPRFIEKFKALNITLPSDIFNPQKVYEL